MPKLSHSTSNRSRQPHSRGNARLFAKTGLWTEEEKRKYLLFLLHHQSRLEDIDGDGEGSGKGIFQAMSRWMGSRKANQCKLYHLKM
jgi:hypothetical protein